MRFTIALACLLLVAFTAPATAGQQETAKLPTGDKVTVANSDSSAAHTEAAPQTPVSNTIKDTESSAQPQQVSTKTAGAADSKSNRTEKPVANPPQ